MLFVMLFVAISGTHDKVVLLELQCCYLFPFPSSKFCMLAAHEGDCPAVGIAIADLSDLAGQGHIGMFNKRARFWWKTGYC